MFVAQLFPNFRREEQKGCFQEGGKPLRFLCLMNVAACVNFLACAIGDYWRFN